MSKLKLISFLNKKEISLGLSSNTSELRFINESMGYGKFATKDIKEGDIIYRVGGMWLTPKEKNTFTEDYFHLVEGAWHFQGGLKYWLNGCHNHNCDPTAYIQENLVIALHDIKENEQVTIDYGSFIDHDFDIIENCTCGSTDCRKRITGKDWQKHKLIEKYNYRVSGTLLTKYLLSRKTQDTGIHPL